jgi:hypothetical protein
MQYKLNIITMLDENDRLKKGGGLHCIKVRIKREFGPVGALIVLNLI